MNCDYIIRRSHLPEPDPGRPPGQQLRHHPARGGQPDDDPGHARLVVVRPEGRPRLPHARPGEPEEPRPVATGPLQEDPPEPVRPLLLDFGHWEALPAS